MPAGSIDPAPLLRDASARLESAGIDSPGLEAELLLEHVSGVPRLRRQIGGSHPLPVEQVEPFEELIRQRCLRIPLQHLLGTADFLELRLRVTRDVLVPRPETEQLALAARERLPTRRGVRVADLGTGSGCLALALAHGRPDLEVHAIDLSPAALEVARDNAVRLGLGGRVQFHPMDAFGPGSSLETLGRFDLIVTNPPYIPSADILELMPEVKDHDPLLALDGGPDGMAPYRVLAQRAQSWLQPQGWLLAEFGDGQAEALVELFRDHGWSEISVGKDLSGRDRILIVRASRPENPATHLGASREDVPHRSHHG